ncbi:MAG: TlpA family protein disulfide reductase [Clostridia bacterium]|nr:TlpA family protein disulfide reductase [Clostridia bacterium]
MKRILCVWMILLLLWPFSSAMAQDRTVYYRLGDTVEDFSLTTVDGEEITLSGLLQEHDAILLNFWFSNCGPSRYEFLFLEKAYELLNGSVEVIAVTPYDDEETILLFRDALDISFPMAYDSAGLTDRFVDYGFPTSVLIDRNGVVCYLECGAQTSSDDFVRLMTLYVLEDYTEPLLLSTIPTLELPETPDGEALNAALNVPGGALAFSCDENAWPWTLSEDGSYLIAANSGSNSSVALVETTFYAGAGDALAFRFRSSTEEGLDLFAILLDGEIAKVFSGENDWTDYALPISADGYHSVAFEYIKNETDAGGEDTVGLDSVALLSGSDAARALDVNPVYPLTLMGMDTSLTFSEGSARRIEFEDPQNLISSFFRLDDCFILNEAQPLARVELGDECDPDAAYIRDLRGNARTLSHCVCDSSGFYFNIPAPEDTLGWNTLMIIPSITDAYGLYTRIYIYFDSEESADSFCQEQVPQLVDVDFPDAVSWHYAE